MLIWGTRSPVLAEPLLRSQVLGGALVLLGVAVTTRERPEAAGAVEPEAVTA